MTEARDARGRHPEGVTWANVGRDVLAGAAGTVTGGLILPVLGAFFGKWIQHHETLSPERLQETQGKVAKWIHFVVVPALLLGIGAVIYAFATGAHIRPVIWIAVIVGVSLLLAFIGARHLTNLRSGSRARTRSPTRAQLCQSGLG